MLLLVDNCLTSFLTVISACAYIYMMKNMHVIRYLYIRVLCFFFFFFLMYLTLYPRDDFCRSCGILCSFESPDLSCDAIFAILNTLCSLNRITTEDNISK